MKSNYDKNPSILVGDNDKDCLTGWESIFGELNRRINKNSSMLIAIETYQGVNDEEVENALKKELPTHKLFLSSDSFKSKKEIEEMIYPYVTDDRIFGFITDLEIKDFLDNSKIEKQKKKIDQDSNSIKVIYGVGASLISDADLLIYIDMARWEIQQRMRCNKVNNLGVDNKHFEPALLYKQSFFVDWKVLDKHKMTIFDNVDYFIDCNHRNRPKMVSGDNLKLGLKKASKQPFRVVPFFDSGVWGGQWLKEIVGLDRSVVNYAWGFDCIPEENSILLDFGSKTFETPAINLVLREPHGLLGDKVYKIFGAEFPIRFNLLDTMEGGNLSLQVHPTKKYIKEKFGMAFTQNESYYYLDAKEDAFVYLGVNENVDPNEMMDDLKRAKKENNQFDVDKYISKWPVKKHDHILIPSGTIHCSVRGSMVLEISATPYNFTFKLYDWGRLGLDNKPRPINIEHGENVIKWGRTSEWMKNNLVNNIKEIYAGENWTEERTGLDEINFIETRRHWFTDEVKHSTDGGVNVLNLIEGREAIVESPTDKFKPFVVHYAETFIIPAAVGDYTIRPYGSSEGQKCGTIKAFVKI